MHMLMLLFMLMFALPAPLLSPCSALPSFPLPLPLRVLLVRAVLRCKVYDVPGGVPDSEAVRIFVVFQEAGGAKKAITVSNTGESESERSSKRGGEGREAKRCVHTLVLVHTHVLVHTRRVHTHVRCLCVCVVHPRHVHVSVRI